MNYTELFTNLKKEIEKKGYGIKSFEIGAPYEGDLTSNLPTEVQAFYNQMDGCHLAWFADDEDELIGEINILSVELASGNYLRNFNDCEGEYMDTPPIWILDEFTIPGCDTKMVYLDGSDEVKYFSEDPFEMKMTFSQYFSALCKGRAIRQVRGAIAVDVSGKEYTTTFSEFVYAMEDYFPEREFDSIFRFHKGQNKVPVFAFSTEDIEPVFFEELGLDESDYKGFTFFCAFEGSFFIDLNASIPEETLDSKVASSGMSLAYRFLSYCQTHPNFRDLFNTKAVGFSAGFHTASIEEVREWVKDQDYVLVSPQKAIPHYLMIKAYEKEWIKDREYFQTKVLNEDVPNVEVFEGVYAVQISDFINKRENFFTEDFSIVNDIALRPGALLELRAN